ncbi:chromosome segregation protein [Paenibacillus shirakamiensis]|uniref:Chromosome partition protein Smc n=1 Tax=Paenibacillus shirakamiensis TaxID=1265935 RepID=A0ABS4JHI0_9BACL|nr:chromosome segregation protein SMC [Paenibacillus shirakamiensis]MBP2001157.1 chromosome segregation protein [Paenibacillus shirakamiensis]
MFLKRIELAGFKSFADRTEMEFVRGITAVVGPNGSGKSNISDGIRWVLGEQSAKSLRGGKMEDIIFAGSDSRKAVGYGEVSLTLDNTDQALPLDFTEVTVTRRVHRSGDSEYLINKQSCRLKDITELFMDTGIGKEAYSIIGQGRIEEILSTRSEDRRGIFEEASGIVKYKSRKKEARKKLDDTEQNLLRIHDLVCELEVQIEPLRAQSAKALHYKELKEQLKHQEISLYIYQIEQIHSNWSEANHTLDKLREEQLALSTVVTVHDAKLEKDRSVLRELENEIEQLQYQLLTYSENYEKNEGFGGLLRERAKNLAQNRQQLLETIAMNDERHKLKKTELNAVEARFKQSEQSLKELRSQLSAEEAKLLGVTGGISQDQEEALKDELLEIMNLMAQTRNEIRYADQQKEGVNRRMERAETEGSKWSEEQTNLGIVKLELEQKLATMAENMAEVRKNYIAESERLHALQKLAEESRGGLRTWEQKREALISRRDTMKEMQDDFDGFALGVKEVLKASRKATLSGVHGAVAELIKVPEKLEMAVETALGAAMQHVVMENETVSRQAIAFLKQRQLGRATFLPLDVIRPRQISVSDKKAIEDAEGFVGIGADLVGFEPRYADIVGNLLGNVVFADSLEHANRMAAKGGYRFRVVTLEGDVVNAGGSMTGGSQHRKNSNLLGRNRQLEQLDHDIRQAVEMIQKLSSSIEEMKQQSVQLELKLDQLRESGDTMRADEQIVSGDLKQKMHEYNHVTEQFTLYGQEKGHYLQELKELDLNKVESQAKLEQLEQKQQSIQDSIVAAEFARKANESAKDELVIQLTELKVREGKGDQEYLSLSEDLRRLTEDCTLQSKELAQNRKFLQTIELELSQNESQSMLQVEDLNDFKLKKTQTGERLEFQRASRTEHMKKLASDENETREQRASLKKVDEQLMQTEIQANRLDVELDNVLKKLSEDYELTYERAKLHYSIPEDIEVTQLDVKEMKRNISALGEVNLGAIEEFDRVSERYEFLSSQKDDLVEAKTTLYQVIREMDEEMSKRFKLTFDAIRREFGKVFTKLFGGGSADLILLDPEHLLETGIDIVAQPPGKKLQNLQLLSGGERALTAMALLFAILQVKPVPFCVLDEVEAALDEANVIRFAQYLREFSEQTQFIVVTHRKGTMEEADVLYGVTMEEGGVSKLVSVRLEDEDSEIA